MVVPASLDAATVVAAEKELDLDSLTGDMVIGWRLVGYGREKMSREYVPDPMELEDHVPAYIPEPDYLEYLAPLDDDIPVEDQPLPSDASLVALSPGYIANFDPEEDDRILPNGGDDDDDDVEEDEEDEKEHLAPSDSIAVASPTVDHVPFAEETEPFETDESAATPPPPTYRTTPRMSVRTQTPIPFPSEEEVARLLALPTLPPSLLTPLSSSPTGWESSAVAAARQSGSTMARRVDYSFMDTMDANIRDTERRTMDAIEKMPPKRTTITTTTTPITDAQLKALIARGVTEALAEIEANKTNRNGDDSHDFGTGSKRTERAARECNYSDFLKCQPLNFKGTEGDIGLS
nr:hypothetical protein [Tanacetum cinerariifolium]